MAQFSVAVADNHVEDLAIALARLTNVPVPTTAAGKRDLAQSFCQAALKQAWVDYRSQRASEAQRAIDDADTL